METDNTYDLVVVGNIAFDVNTFPGHDQRQPEVVTNLGGAGFYSYAPACMVSKKVGIVARVGFDFPVDQIVSCGGDTRGLRVCHDAPTIRFHHTYLSEDGQDRTFRADVDDRVLITPDDFPQSYLNTRYIHVATNYPATQIAFIEALRGQTQAQIAIDTHEAYLETHRDLVYEAFSMVDIAFIDQQERGLLAMCAAGEIVVKRGKRGLTYRGAGVTFDVPTTPCRVVDKTGAGDVLASIFLASRAGGATVQQAARSAVNAATASVKAHGVQHLLADGGRMFPHT